MKNPYLAYVNGRPTIEFNDVGREAVAPIRPLVKEIDNKLLWMRMGSLAVCIFLVLSWLWIVRPYIKERSEPGRWLGDVVLFLGVLASFPLERLYMWRVHQKYRSRLYPYVMERRDLFVAIAKADTWMAGILREIFKNEMIHKWGEVPTG